MRFSHSLIAPTCLFILACSNNVQQTSGTGTTGSSSGGAGGDGTTVTTTSSLNTSVAVTTGTGGQGGIGDIGQASTKYPAPHPAAPFVENSGGPLLTSPKVVVITFADEVPADRASVETFASQIGPSAYWATALGEYGVGPITALPPIELTEMSQTAIADTDIVTWLQDKLNTDDAAFPPEDGSIIYAIFYPQTTTITLSSGGVTEQSCHSFGGYHDETVLDDNHIDPNTGNPQKVVYAVLPECKHFQPGLSQIDGVTSAASHEFAEASTDPYPNTDPAYSQNDLVHFYFGLALGGSEIGDMCAQNPGAFTTFPGITNAVQRMWSNVSAQAGTDPCLPAIDGEVYFNAVPVLNDNISLGQGASFKGVNIPVGGTKTIDIDLFSDAETGPLTVMAVDDSQQLGGGGELDMSFDVSSGVNGQKLHLTITVASASQYMIEPFTLYTTNGSSTNLWVGAVGN